MSHIIELGPRAGQPVHSTDDVLDRMTYAKRVTINLKRKGFEVLDARIVFDKRPVIKIRRSRQCEKLVAEGTAVYYRIGPTQQRGQFEFDGARVIWVEPILVAAPAGGQP